MLDIALQSLANVLQFEVLLFLIFGVSVGIFVGILPGLGGVVGMSLLLPFIFGMDLTAGLALLLGMAAVTQTADTFTSVLLGVPGSSSSQATIMDGYPMSQQGRAAEALGAGFTASILGGVFGALLLFVAIFAARPIILAFQSPQLLMLTLLGLAMVGILSRGAPLAGILAGVLGLLIGGIGAAPTTAVYRFSFGQVYLFDGLKISILAMGLFAIPELIDLLVAKRTIAAEKLSGSMFDGVRQTLRHKWLVVRSAGLGTLLGFLPGLGGSVVDWIAYGAAVQTYKDGNFGKGDIRGVIAPESANNAKEGGTLIPTLLFGIPGSGTTAILLGGFILLGIQVGPRMITDELPTVISIVWILALANVIGAAACIFLGRWIARITEVPPTIFAPFLFVLLTAAAYQGGRQWGDVIMLFVIGLMGWVMKQVGWPRAPMLIGFVLSSSTERFLWISHGLYGWEFLLKPSVMALGVLILITLYAGSRFKSSLEARVDATVAIGKEPAATAGPSTDGEGR